MTQSQVLPFLIRNGALRLMAAAEAGRADHHVLALTTHPHVVRGVVEEVVGNRAVEDFTHGGKLAEESRSRTYRGPHGGPCRF